MVPAIHILIAFFLFLLINWLGSKSGPLEMGYVQISLDYHDDAAPAFNYLFKVLSPVIAMIVLYAIFEHFGLGKFNSNIYWVVIDYWIIRLIIIIAKGRLGLVNWVVLIIYWVSSIGLARCAYSLFDKTSVLPSASSMVDEMWLIIILFLYSVVNKLGGPRENTRKRIGNYITKQYCRFRIEYDYLLENVGSFQKALLYSIMIYEDFNRPRIARIIEKILFCKSTKKHTYGIMQVQSDHFLTTEESIALAKERIKTDLAFVLKEKKMKSLPKSEYKLFYVARQVAQRYNPKDPDYGYHVGEVFERVYDSFYAKNNSEVKEEQLFL